MESITVRVDENCKFFCLQIKSMWSLKKIIIIIIIINVIFIIIIKSFILIFWITTISRFPRCFHDVLKGEKLLQWRRLQDVFADQQILPEYIFAKHLIFSKLLYRLKACNFVSKGIAEKTHRKFSEIFERAIL